MKKYIVLAIIFLFISHEGWGQKNENPKNIMEAITFLEKDCPDSLKVKIKNGSDSELARLCYSTGEYGTVYNWIGPDNKRSRIKKYLTSKGIEYYWNQQDIILIAFKQYLLGEELDEDDIIEPFKEEEDELREEKAFNSTADSIDGSYIPKNLDDCFKQLDVLLPDSLKTKFKGLSEDEFRSNVHFGLGKNIRNTWRLWRWSRLAKYFNKKGIDHADDMSGIILKSYHRHLTGKKIKLKEQIRYYQAYWKAITTPSEKIYPKGIKNLEFDQRAYYYDKEKSRYGCVHIQTNSKSDKTWVYDYYHGWKLITEDDLKVLESSDYDNREDIIKEIFNEKKAGQ